MSWKGYFWPSGWEEKCESVKIRYKFALECQSKINSGIQEGSTDVTHVYFMRTATKNGIACGIIKDVLLVEFSLWYNQGGTFGRVYSSAR